MAKFFINRPIFAIVVALVISIAGLLCMLTLTVDRYPKITPPQVGVNAFYPGRIRKLWHKQWHKL